jgi:hypothetical protein
MENNELIKIIKEAFISEEYPGDNNLAYSDNGCFDVEEIKQNFTGKLWHALDKDFLLKNRESIYFFSKAAFKYYIPAFMLATIQYYDDMDDLPDRIIGVFLLPEKEDIIEMSKKLKSFPQIEGIKTINYGEYDAYIKTSLQSFEETREYFFEKANEFNKGQRNAIKMYLEYMEKYQDDLYNDPKVALERYWGNI